MSNGLAWWWPAHPPLHPNGAARQGEYAVPVRGKAAACFQHCVGHGVFNPCSLLPMRPIKYGTSYTDNYKKQGDANCISLLILPEAVRLSYKVAFRTVRPDFTTVIMETRTIAAFAARVPVQVIVAAPKTGDAALNMVWNKTHINTRPFPDIL